MSTEKDSPCSVNDENSLKSDYHCPTSHLSPSSWDDSSEELTDEDSCTTVELPTDDRRQSLARVKRRRDERSLGSPVFDTDYSKNSSDEYVSNSGKTERQEAMSSDPSLVQQGWNDLDSEEIILGIENYLNEKRLSLIRSKIAGNQSNINEYASVLNGKGRNQTEIFSGVDFRSNLNGKLSKIVEVEESKSNTSLRSSETPRSAVSLCSKTNKKSLQYPADGNSNLYCDTSHGVDANNTECIDHGFITMKYLSGDKFVNLTDENDSDDSEVIWQGFRSEIKRNSNEYIMTYNDSEFVSNGLKCIFDENKSQNASNLDEDGFELSDEKGEVNIKHGTFENEVCVDGGGDNRKGEKGNESITPDGVAAVQEAALNNDSSKETVDFRLENIFSYGQKYFLTDGYAVNDIARQDGSNLPRSGREAFLVRGPSAAWNIPTVKSGSKRVRGNHTISILRPEKRMHYLKESNQILRFKENCEQNQLDYTEQEMPFKRESFLSSRREKDESYCDSNNERLNDSKNCIINEDVTRDGRESTPISCRSKILLDLNLSDNEVKCSSIERVDFSKLTEDTDKNATPRNSGKASLHSTKSTIAVGQNLEIIEKLGTKPAEEFHNGSNKTHSCDCHKYGSGDNEWNADETFGRKIHFPQDRGDITYVSPDTKSEWFNLIISLEDDYNDKKPEITFYMDTNKNRPDCQVQNSESKTRRDMKQKSTLNIKESSHPSKMYNAYSHFSKKKKHRKTKAKNRKEINLSADGRVFSEIELETNTPRGNRLFDRRGNWLVNSDTRREDVLTRSKRWFQALMVARKRGRRGGGYQHKAHSSTHISRKSADCFCNLFKQIVNIFTVSGKSRK